MTVHLLGGRYELTERISAGGMGVVWAARDRVLHRTVAVKVLSGAGVAPDAVARLEREARAAAGLAENPHVVTVHDFGRDGDAVFVVMERVAGETLDAVLRAGAPPRPDVAADWVRQVCTALEAAHAAGVIHRDIKPANAILTPDGTVKVLDFGIALFHPRHGLERLSRDLVVGSVPWMSPEQIRGGSLDHRSDLYSVGCLLYELLTGRPPFGDRDAYGQFVAHVTEQPTAPGLVRPGVPPALDALTMRLLAKSPDARPDSAAAVAAELAPLSRGPAAAAGPQAPSEAPAAPEPGGRGPGAPHPAGGGGRRRSLRRPALVAAACVAFAMLLIAGALWLDGPDGGRDSNAGTAGGPERSPSSPPASGAPGAPGAGEPGEPARLPRTPADTSPLPPGWHQARETRYRMVVPVPDDFTASDNEGEGMIYYGPGDQLVISVYHEFDVAKPIRQSLRDQLGWYLDGADGTMGAVRSTGVGGLTLLGLPGLGFEVTYHKDDSARGTRHRRIERGVQDDRGEEVYFRVEYPDTPEYDARAREVLGEMEDRILLHPR
ncbi:serine/threonine-protein kinase [Streptomyces sp. MAR4 CNX-425]|uniref:serine/threonine-protein kinase n=1 Tax=Streptomyces sp. MAR4 CNX-425 TaxID=3406343 RepID=UPI003B509C5C